jgi:hypothetical protein
MPRRSVDESLEVLGCLSRAARLQPPAVDLTAPAVERRLQKVSQLRALCLYLMRMNPQETEAHGRH